MTAEELRERASTCRSVARDMLNLRVVEALVEVADEFDNEALSLEAAAVRRSRIRIAGH